MFYLLLIKQFSTIQEEQLVGPDVTEEYGAPIQGSIIIPDERSLSLYDSTPTDVPVMSGPSNVNKLSDNGEMASFGQSTTSRDSETPLICSSIDIIDPPEEFRVGHVLCHVFSYFCAMGLMASYMRRSLNEQW